MCNLSILDELSQPQVRDLAWAALSANLLQHPSEKIVAGDWFSQRIPDLDQRLRYWDAQPQPLLDELNKHKSHFLGPYFEQLIVFLLRHTADIEIIAERLQIHHDGHTLGEFDLLFHDAQTQQFFHWELALKYFIGFSRQPGETFWWGPNANDRLDLKVAKTFDQQLRLSEQHGDFLSAHGVNTQPIAQALTKGYLFHPHQDSEEITPQFDSCISLQHQRGWWRRWSGTQTAIAKSSSWLVLNKPHWLAPLSAGMIASQRMNDEMLNQHIEKTFARGFRALMVAEVSQIDGVWQECSRGMLVSEDWPDIKPNRKKI
jgi:hypothetical protein